MEKDLFEVGKTYKPIVANLVSQFRCVWADANYATLKRLDSETVATYTHGARKHFVEVVPHTKQVRWIAWTKHHDGYVGADVFINYPKHLGSYVVTGPHEFEVPLC